MFLSPLLTASGLAVVAVFPALSQTATPPPLGRLVEVDSHRVHLYCTGNGSPAVVVVSGGFSFDWALIQPEIAQRTQICTYDTAGTAWSDPVTGGGYHTCGDRVTELHGLLHDAAIPGPYILVGYSIGGLVVRLYLAKFPNEIAGVVLVDHAFLDTPANTSPPPAPSTRNSPPVLISQTPITLDFEDDRNFSKLPAHDQALHRWALPISFRPTAEMASQCFSEVAARTTHPTSLGQKPLVVVSTLNDSPRYAELQRKLLSLSQDSRQLIADDSSHMVPIDQPQIVIKAIDEVLEAVRK